LRIEERNGERSASRSGASLGGVYSRTDRSVPEQYGGADSEARLARLKSLAIDLGKSGNQIVLAWLMQSKPWAIPLAAGSTVEQLLEDLAADEIKLTADQIAWLSIYESA
jgi:aryl-alcohol dehydrogenase-like predicted oxidoreductase